MFILRHANADTEAANDDDRKLSKKGRKQAKRVAKFLRRHNDTLELDGATVLSSPIRRANQTASIVVKKTRKLKLELISAPWLACGAKPEKVCLSVCAKMVC